ncbi:MAG TPA: HWE histidine kinase domain-containing protein [Xanthobacteraceae bacterium]|jgi:two-component sensor histidine kinase
MRLESVWPDSRFFNLHHFLFKCECGCDSDQLIANEQAREKEQQTEVLAELADMRRLQEISVRLVEQDNIAALYDAILDAAMGLLRSDMGMMQLFDPLKGKLRLLNARGFDSHVEKAFEWIGPDNDTCCAAALRASRRVVVADVDNCEFIVPGSPAHQVLHQCGIGAVQSTPLISRSGRVLGIISNQWRAPREPKERELLIMDVLARLAADLIERKQNEEKITLLAREAEHRAKNILAAVQATVHLTQAETVEDFKEAVEGRIQALANSHNLLVQSRWQGADLESLVTQELSPYCKDGEKRTHIHGPYVVLEPGTAQAVAAALHELATNAAKYGALSRPDGHVEISWSNDQAPGVSLRWIESAGGRIQPPKHEGFGTRMLKALIRGQMKGDVRFDWRTDGLICEITLPKHSGA